MTRLEAFIAEQINQTISVAVYDFETGKEIYINPDTSFHPASTFKVHVMMEVFHQAQEGLLSLEAHLPIINSFTIIADGSKYALDVNDDAEKTLYPRLGESEAIRELTRLMIVRSSNLATNILIEKVGTKNVATARGLTQTMKLIAERKVVSKPASEEMIKIMLGQEFNESIPALLPKSARVAHKTGWTEKFYHDTGIVFPEARKPYAISIMTRGFAEEAEKSAHECMATISKMIYGGLP